MRIAARQRYTHVCLCELCACLHGRNTSETSGSQSTVCIEVCQLYFKIGLCCMTVSGMVSGVQQDIILM